ncbi:predicted protein [Plenodomus lingam JN3]|uniref:Predicted protein n=1 Tax=Leptosphaeria maculans (strain JN3 / isolate v23.1.3 / race Av1-4-5-6-7-8) TaxID=985895 RepID=E4ZLY4_LEPMJ|nr:predicted protein [Plenodomus lingam JN3]CBX92814.1 predicted protein [Plenodomus lingam JN3]
MGDQVLQAVVLHSAAFISHTYGDLAYTYANSHGS